jgi:arylsulfatase A-like enzyme
VKKLTLLIVLVLFIAGIYFLRSWSTYQAPHGIILISLDTLRADHVGVYGYYRNTTPFIDAFAEESIVFENAVVQAPTTLPSHMSIMTSLYPHSHGVKRNTSLPSENLTLAELLQQGGYKTAAFVDGGWMRAVFGFSQGFETYDGEEKIGIAKILPKVKKWVDKNKSHPFFLFMHCYDIHSPYDPPPPYDMMFQDTVYTGSFVAGTENLRLAAWNQIRLSDQDLRYTIALYDGGIRYTDEMIGEFFAYLRNAGLYDNSLIIVTSDHGEEFMEHGSFLHWRLYYRPNLHVPLIMRVPTLTKKEMRIDTFVQSIDLLPTILDFAKLPPPPGSTGKKSYATDQNEQQFLLPLKGTSSTICKH